MKPKWLLNEKKSYREQSDKRVKEIAKKTGGKVTPNSGATPFSKGDMVYPEQLVEHKMTSKKSYKLNESDLAKIYREGIKARKTPFFVVEFKEFNLIGEVRKRL